jgi:exodeoxyribonuclease-3
VAVYTPNSGDMLKRLTYRVEEWDRDMHDHLEKLKKSLNGR